MRQLPEATTGEASHYGLPHADVLSDNGTFMAIIEDLRQALGDDAVLTGAAIGERYRSDASQTGEHLPRAVLRQIGRASCRERV